MELKIKTDLLDIKFKDFETHLTWRDTTNYAASIGDNNPLYFDDRGTEALCVHPVIVNAINWRLMMRLNEYLEVPKGYQPNIEAANRNVHYTEHIIFQKPLSPNSVIVLKGAYIACVPRKAGTYQMMKFDAVDPDGNLIYTEYIGGMMRDVTIDGEPRGEENIPSTPVWKEEAAPLWTEDIYISPQAPYVYDGCTDIIFPIHSSPKFAADVGLPGIIYQGSATMAHAATAIINKEAEGKPYLLSEIFVQFAGMVMPDSTITVECIGRVERERHIEVFFNVRKQDGTLALKKGYAKFKKSHQ